jgi:hypothetical protein
MLTKTVRSPFSHEVGEDVGGCKILEKRVVIPPDPIEKRRGVYDYLVEEPPAVAKPRSSRQPRPAASASPSAPEPKSFTRSTPDEMGGRLIRRVPSR